MRFNPRGNVGHPHVFTIQIDYMVCQVRSADLYLFTTSVQAMTLQKQSSSRLGLCPFYKSAQGLTDCVFLHLLITDGTLLKLVGDALQTFRDLKLDIDVFFNKPQILTASYNDDVYHLLIRLTIKLQHQEATLFKNLRL